MNEKGGFCFLGMLPRRADVTVKHSGISLECCSYIQPLLCSLLLLLQAFLVSKEVSVQPFHAVVIA